MWGPSVAGNAALGSSCPATAIRIRGPCDVVEAAARELKAKISAERRTATVALDDAEMPPSELLRDLQAAIQGFGAKLEVNNLASPGTSATLSGFGDIDKALLQIVLAKESSRESRRAPPNDWTTTPASASSAYVLSTVLSSSPAWKNVESLMKPTMPNATIIKVERVENHKQWKLYTQRRSEVAAESKSGFDCQEVHAFHGTRKYPVVNICENGLDFRHGNEACMWGIALYVAANASYSDAYSSVHSSGDDSLRQFFLTRVCLGRTIELKPDKTLRAPPPGYESVQGLTQGSTVYMTYDRGQAYPEYLVTYKRG